MTEEYLEEARQKLRHMMYEGGTSAGRSKFNAVHPKFSKSKKVPKLKTAANKVAMANAATSNANANANANTKANAKAKAPTLAQPRVHSADEIDAVFVKLDVDGNGEIEGEVSAGRFDVTDPGPQQLGTTSVGSTFYDSARFVIAPADSDSVHAIGSLTCGADTVTFDWSFDTATTYVCEPEDLNIPSGGEASTQLTIHGDHFFYDGLEADDAVVRGQAIVDADANADGEVTLDELAEVDVASIGYAVGQYSDVTDLREFVTFLTRTLGHVDGEGHCQVDL